MIASGAYPAPRAAALSGVPLSTVHWWARHEILVPSISPERVKYWSYADLMGLRTIYWLRQTKKSPEGHDVPRSTMPAVRKALAQLAQLDLALWSEETGPGVRVDRAGRIHLTTTPHVEDPSGQRTLDDNELDLLSPFDTESGRGPDLIAPRPKLRIVPGKLGGSPHVIHTRLESQVLGSLRESGLATAKIYQLYPRVDRAAIQDAIDLETQLATNLRTAA